MKKLIKINQKIYLRLSHILCADFTLDLSKVWGKKQNIQEKLAIEEKVIFNNENNRNHTILFWFLGSHLFIDKN